MQHLTTWIGREVPATDLHVEFTMFEVLSLINGFHQNVCLGDTL